MRRKKRKSGKIIFGILIVAALGVSAFVAYEYFLKPKEEDKPAEPSQIVTPTPVETPVDQGRGEAPEQPLEKEPVVQYDGNDPNTNASLTGVVTYAGATANNIIIRVNIDQYIDGGTCKLNLSQNGAVVYTATSNLIADVTTATCDGFNLSRSVVGSGNFGISIELNSGDKSGIIGGELNL